MLLAACFIESFAAPLVARLVAQATPIVAPDARVYRDIDRLTAAGLIDTIIVGIRPYSRREIRRLLTEAQRNLGRNGSARAWAEPTIASDLEQYAARDIRWAKPIDAIALDATYSGSTPRAAPIDSNGFLRASIDPLTAYREGRRVDRGASGGIETRHSIELTNWLAVAVNPRLWVSGGNEFIGSTDPRLTLQSGSVNMLFGNLSIEAGRDYVLFGQSPTGGLLLSENAPALDMIRVSNDRPAALPSILKYIGPMRGTLLLADLGKNQFHAHPKLIGYHISALPHPALELGLEVTDIMGGNGVPGFSTSSAIVDALPFIDPILRRRSDFISNKFVGGDFRWRVPGATGVQLYGEGALDDFDLRRLRSSLLEDGGYIFGLSASCLADCGRLGVRAEFHQTGIRYYTHSDYDMQQDGQILGDPLGPRGLGGYLTFDGDAGRAGELALSTAFEARSGNTYGSAVTGADTRGFHFVLLSRRPGEKRTRVVATWTPGPRDRRMTLSISAGAERVTNFAFDQGRDRTNGLAQIRYEFRP